MKKILSIISLAVLTVGLLCSCSKINERIDDLDKRIYDIENDKIASVEQQITAIKESIADLETIRTNIQTLIEAKTTQGEDITKLKEADQTLEGKINDLNDYVNTELAKYATKDWANATFATLAKQDEIITDVEKLKQDLAGLDDKLDQAIANLDSTLKSWVNEQLSGYYTVAEINAKIDDLKSDIDALEGDNETNKDKIEELETSLTQLTQDLATAKADIKTAYEKAIKEAIEGNDGYITETIKDAIDEANGKITDLTGRVEDLEDDVTDIWKEIDALKAMIQTVSIIPAYSDGSVKAEGGILTINCVITPKTAVEGLARENFTILTSESEVLTKSALYGTIAIAKDDDLVLDKVNGTATIKVDVSSALPTEEGKALTVAVNVKNGISDYTTGFVSVCVEEESCIAAGTMITMENGEQKAVEKLELGDAIRTFDHETGEVSSSKVCFIMSNKNVAGSFTLTFEDGISVCVIEEHGFYDWEEQKYAFINPRNAKDYIGHHFYDADNERWLELKSCEVLPGSVDAYAIVTSRHLNHTSNGMLSMCDGTIEILANLFEYDNQMRFDTVKKNGDIEKYGLTSKEKVLEYEGFTESDYENYNLQYLDIAIGKGLTSWELVQAFSDYCVANGIF